MLIQVVCNIDIQFVLLSNNKNNHTFLFHVCNLHISYFLLLGFDLSRVLQHGHIISLEKKNNAHKEHHFWPIIYLRLLENDSFLNLIHSPLHVWAIMIKASVMYLRKFPNSGLNFFQFQQLHQSLSWSLMANLKHLRQFLHVVPFLQKFQKKDLMLHW